MKKRLLTSICLFFVAVSFALPTHAATFTSAQSGVWTDTQTWNGVQSYITSSSFGVFELPNDVAVAGNGDVYILGGAGNDVVYQFNSAGGFIRQWGTPGSAEGQFSAPSRIAIDPSGNVWVTDTNNYRVQKFTASGAFIFAIGWGVATGANAQEICTSNCRAGIAHGGVGNGGFSGGNGTFGITADHFGNMYIGDVGSIYKYDNTGHYITEWNTQFGNETADLAVDASNNIYIASYSDRVVEYTSTGTLVKVIGWGVATGANNAEVCTANCLAGINGSGDGQLQTPPGIAVDSFGNIYVRNGYDTHLVKFNASGNYVATFVPEVAGSNGGSGLGSDSTNNIYLAANIRIGTSARGGVLKLSSTGTQVPVNICQQTNSCVLGVDYPGSTDDAVMANNATVTTAASSAHTVHSVFINIGSTLAQGANSTLTLSGIWLNTGTYTPGANSTVVLKGTTQAILGNGTTFANLTKISSVSDVLKLTTTTMVSGLLTLKGVANNLLSLVSAAFTPPTWLSEFIISTAGVDYPSGIAIDSAGNYYISNCGTTPGVYKYDPSGTYLSSFGVGTLACPYGLAVDPAGNLYVGDDNSPDSNSFVYKYAPNGTLIARWGSDGLGGTLPIGAPVGLIYDNGHVFVSVSNSGTGYNAGIYEFDADGNYIKLIGNAELENNAPEYLAADSEHNLYVATYYNDRVYKYSSTGTFISSFKVGVNGETRGAEAVAIAPNGYIYVGRYDSPNFAGKIHIFDPNGNFVTTFGSAGTGHSQFSFYDPVMTFGSAGNFYTVDNNDDYRVQKFSVPTSMTVTPWNISAGSTDFSFLSVANSVASTIFHCLSGCTDGGGNTNWDFGTVASTTAPPPPHRSGSRSHVSSTSGGGASSAGGVQGTPAPTTTDSPAAIKASLQAVTTVSRNLVYGTVSNDVLLLQKFLNAYGFPVAASGVGSSGHETKFFGTLTKVAVKKFQQSVALPVTGFFGPLTRQMISTIRP